MSSSLHIKVQLVHFYRIRGQERSGLRNMIAVSYTHLDVYKRQAVDCPRGFRAVGMANHNNPIPIFIPCHRVVGADGSLTGYGGGLELKKALLALEGHHF